MQTWWPEFSLEPAWWKEKTTNAWTVLWPPHEQCDLCVYKHAVHTDAQKRKGRRKENGKEWKEKERTFNSAICLYIKSQHCVGIAEFRTYGTFNHCDYVASYFVLVSSYL